MDAVAQSISASQADIDSDYRECLRQTQHDFQARCDAIPDIRSQLIDNCLVFNDLRAQDLPLEGENLAKLVSEAGTKSKPNVSDMEDVKQLRKKYVV